MSSVSFDDSFITRAYTDPAPTLAAYDSLWKEEAFTLVSDRHRHSATPLDHATIRAHIIALIHEGLRSYAEAYYALAPIEMTLNL